MLAVSAEAAPEGPDWLYEIKLDGVRALCSIDDGSYDFFSRKGESIRRQYPELSGVVKSAAARTAVLDGEIVALDSTGRPSFQALQPRIMNADEYFIAREAKARPVSYYVFDLLTLNGHDLRKLPFSERRKRLAKILKPSARVKLSETFNESPADLLAAAREQGMEGILAKRASSPYFSGRSSDWVKVKNRQDGDFVICGFTDGEREHFASLVLGAVHDGKLRYSGNVGTGFDNKTLAFLAAEMQPLITTDCPFERKPKLRGKVTWLEPKLVCMVRYHEVTKDGRLRAPSYMGLRDDKEPAQAGDAKSLLSHPDRIYFPKDGYTKRDLADYYESVGEWILPHLRDRPLSLKRYPEGIAGDFFFQKDASKGLPKWIPTAETGLQGKPLPAPVCNDIETLLALLNLGSIDVNPWMSRTGSLEHPDWVLIDLDPHHASYDRVVEAGLAVRKLLLEIGLSGYPKTTGGDGMHVYIPLDPVYDYEQSRQLAEVLAQLALLRYPKLFTIERSLAKRPKDRVYFDFMQNGMGKTISSPYCVRPHDGAPVAMPLDWKEVKKGLGPSDFNLKNAARRLRRKGDLFAPVLQGAQRLEQAAEKLESLLS